ncbi:MAG: hypothetical protein DBP01_05220 [gamma proteobacterium symbiont of Ctena orbiculata]|nr:MAG: hypothetical protein DBP01_05220 [gamma proteobacterium symbiont of Ctena orbiculata]
MVVPGHKLELPESLRRVKAVTPQFDHARDPLISAQLKAMDQTESQRRKAQGRGSLMVKSDRPFPELRPKHERAPIRATFNQAWLKEQRDACMALFDQQRKQQRGEQCAIAQSGQTLKIGWVR